MGVAENYRERRRITGNYCETMRIRAERQELTGKFHPLTSYLRPLTPSFNIALYPSWPRYEPLVALC